MKLNDDQVEQVGNQTGLKPIPEDNPATPRLQERFGEHTFYLDANGLYIWEPVDDVGRGQAGAEADHADPQSRRRRAGAGGGIVDGRLTGRRRCGVVSDRCKQPVIAACVPT